MADFEYNVKRILRVPNRITVKGKEIAPYIDYDDYDDGYPPSIEYGDEVDDKYDWTITLIPDKEGEFTIRLTVNGDIIAKDNFYPDDTPVEQMLDRFIDTLEGLI